MYSLEVPATKWQHNTEPESGLLGHLLPLLPLFPHEGPGLLGGESMGLTSARRLAPRSAGTLSGQLPLSFTHQDAPEVARVTNWHLATRGWCLWKCSAVGGDVLVVVDPHRGRSVPAGYCVYTVTEIYALAQLDPTTIRLVHEAKRVAGAVISSVEVSG